MQPLIVICAHNEEDNIAEIVRACKEYGDVYVVDDGSTDDTADRADKVARWVFFNGVGSQYGDGFRQGCYGAEVREAKQVVFMNAGGSHFPGDIPRLLEGLKDADVVIGSRIVPHAICIQPWFRVPMTHLATWVLGKFLGRAPVDYSSFRAFNKWGAVVAHDIALALPKETRLFNPLLTYKLYKSGLKINHVPISYKAINNQLHLGKFIKTFWTLLKYTRSNV